MRNTSRRYTPKKFYFTNQNIQAETLRVIDHENKQVGILPKMDAIRAAQERELDLVLIAPTAKPPVAKITDFKKFLYQEEKKLKEARKGVKKSVVKDIKISLFIGESDRERLIEKAKEFLEDGFQVRLNLGLRGREMGKQMMAYDKLRLFITSLGEVNISKEPKMEGRVIRAVVARKK